MDYTLHLSIENRLRIFRWLLVSMLLSQMALCSRLWQADRGFPSVPAFDTLSTLPQSLTLILVAAFVVAVILVATFAHSKFPVFTAIALGCVLVMFDINRLQPWFYTNLLFLLALSVETTGERSARSAWSGSAMIITCLYFWSGLQKANLTFATDVFPWIIAPLKADCLKSLWYFAPVGEAAVAMSLFIPKTRTYGLVALAAMHLMLLAALGPFGHNYNSVVWPWNLMMPILAATLFGGNKESIIPSALNSAAGKIIVLFAGIMPALSFVGLWDTYPSFSLYSGRERIAYILFTGDGASQLAFETQSILSRGPDRIGLDLTRWALMDLNVPPYPEKRVYVAIAKRLGVSSTDVRLLVREPVGPTTRGPKLEPVLIY